MLGAELCDACGNMEDLHLRILADARMLGCSEGRMLTHTVNSLRAGGRDVHMSGVSMSIRSQGKDSLG